MTIQNSPHQYETTLNNELRKQDEFQRHSSLVARTDNHSALSLGCNSNYLCIQEPEVKGWQYRFIGTSRWRTILPSYKIANCRFSDLGPSWTNNIEWRKPLKTVTQAFKNERIGTWWKSQDGELYQLRRLPIKERHSEPRILYLYHTPTATSIYEITKKGDWEKCLRP